LKPHSSTMDAANSEAQYRRAAAYKAAQRRRQELYDRGAADDGLKDKIIIAGVVMTIVFVIFHTASTRREALAEAASRSRAIAEHNRQRRQALEDERLSLSSVPSNSEKL